MSLNTRTALRTWRIVDSGVQPGTVTMSIDQQTLSDVMNDVQAVPTLHFFQWNKPTVSFGYLLNEEEAKRWANGKPTVKRPTGGGAVLHTDSDLSFSLAWRRGTGLFSEAPRTCYAEIHKQVLAALQPDPLPTLSLKGEETKAQCGEKINRFSLCFQEPVCNDIMLGGKKIVGGALRITKSAILYQGTIQLPTNTNIPLLKKSLMDAFN